MGGINRTDADKYFKVGSHPAAALWNAAGTDERDAAVEFAKKQLERVKGSTLTATTGNSNIVEREDYALYEQALHVLTHNPYRSNGENTAVAWDLTQADGDALQTREQMDTLCKAAVRFMGWWPMRIVRG